MGADEILPGVSELLDALDEARESSDSQLEQQPHFAKLSGMTSQVLGNNPPKR